MERRSNKYFDKKILDCIYATLESEEADADANSLFFTFDECMRDIDSEVEKENKKRIETNTRVYNISKEIIKLFELAIILDPTISKEKKALLMESFDVYNNEKLKDLTEEYRKTLRSSKLFNIPKKMIDTLSSNLEQQKLYNDEYNKSVQEKTITPKLHELLVSFKKHDPKFVEEYSGDTKSIVNDWISQDSATIAANTDNPDNLPISLMNEVDGGRKRIRRRIQSKKSKHNRFIKKSRKMRKSRKSRKSRKTKKSRK